MKTQSSTPSNRCSFIISVKLLVLIAACVPVAGAWAAVVNCAGWISTGTAPFTQLIKFVALTTGCEHSFLLMLPDEYNANPSKDYPVLYWLPGGREDQVSGDAMAEFIHDAINTGKIPPIIMVIGNGPGDTHWADAKDGSKPIETFVVTDLVNYIDSNYRTITQREARWIEGFSVGGRGAAHYGLEYPEIFGAYSSQSGALMNYDFFTYQMPDVVADHYGSDPGYFNQHDPITLANQNAASVRGRTVIRALLGTVDPIGGPDDRMIPGNDPNPYGDIHYWTAQYTNTLTQLDIPYTFIYVGGVHHNYWGLMTSMEPSEGDPYKWYNDAFAKISIGANTAPVANAGADQTVTSGATVTLNGSGPFDPDGYPITYSWAQTAGPAVVLSSTTAANPTFMAPTVTVATTLTFQQTVFDASLSSSDSVDITVNALGGTDTQPPTVPQNLTARLQTATSVELTWSASTDNVGVKDYRIYRAVGSGVLRSVTNTTATSFIDSGLQSNTLYKYAVSAIDGAGNKSMQSTTVTVQTR